ncbi:hypothetical protein EMCRGX_G019974 [Ephydatia muelleri]
MGRTTAALVAVLLVNLVSLTNAFHGDGESWSFTKHTYGLSLDVPAKLVCEYLWPGSHSRMVAPRDGNGGYVIRSALVDQLDGKYIVGHQYTVDLVGLVNPYEGFIIQARDRWNEGLILGSFIPLDTSKAQTIHCLGNDHGTVTHNSKDPVSVQSFIWQAPPTLEGSGKVDFVYSVMQSSLQYWVRINASSPVLTYKEVQADGVSPMDAPCPSAPAANAVYRFTATNPPNCVQSSCDYFLGIRTNDNDPTYLDFMLEGSANGWIGVGFAPGPAMASADVLGCIMVITTGNLAIVDAWNLPASPDNNNVRDDIQNVCPHSANYSNGRIQCVFSRQIITNDTTQDVPMNGSYYLLYGRGEKPTGSPPTLSYHTAQFTPPISDNPIEPDTASNTPIPTHPCPSSPAANAVYRFTATNPPNCVQSSCDYFLGIRTNDNDPTYLDFMLEGSTTGWIGVGFAPAQAMASADVLGCIMVITTGNLAIVDAWNLPASPDNNNVRDDIQNVCPHSASYSNGRIQCVFSRQIITNDTAQDVPMNGSYYLLYGRGEKPTGSPPTLSYHTAQFTPPISDNPIEPDTASNTPIPTHPCPSSPAANAVYRFTATNPPNCVQSSCDYFLGIRTNDNDPTYLDFMLEGSATGWIGVGFAPAQAMPSADVLGCVVLATSSEVAIVDAWNIVGGYINVRDSIQNVCPHSASYSNGRIQCVFSRQIVTNDTTQDVPMNGSYYLLYGRGEIPTGSSPPGLTFHGAQFTPPFSDGLVDPATFEGNSSGEVDELHSVMVRVHGVVMTVAFSIFGVIGIFFAAWMKPVLVQDGCWFQIHRAMMIASLLLGVFGFICIFVAHRHASFRGYYGLVPLDNPGDIIHFTWGIAVMAMLVANPIIALFRCKPNAPRRWIYNLIHGVIVGLLFELLVCIHDYHLAGVRVHSTGQNISIRLRGVQGEH